jgi:general secretion pathway protein F
MKRFNFTAKNSQSQVVRDQIDAESRQAALNELRRQGLTVVSITAIESSGLPSAPSDSQTAAPPGKQSAKIPFWKYDLGALLTSDRVKTNDLAVFCRQLAISVNSGLPLRDALTGIHQDMDAPAFKKILADILERLHNGVAFSKAAAHHPKVFTTVFIGLLRAAEESGSMGETMARLADYLESSDRLRRKVGSLMAYPAFVAVFFIAISMVMVFWIVPQFQDIFGDLGSRLPPLTQAVFALNSILIHRAPLVGAVLAAVALLFFLFHRSKTGQLFLAETQLKLPWIGECIKQYVIARVCRCLAIMLKSGVPIATGLQIVSKVGNNLAIEKSLIQAREQTVSGSNIADSLDRTNIFPSLLIRMVKVGESAGRLPEVLDNVAGAYEDRVENTITTGMSLLEPIVIVVFGALVLVLVVSIYLPVMTVASHM